MKVQEQLIFKTPETGRFYNIELNYIYKLNYIGLNFTELKNPRTLTKIIFFKWS